MKRNSRGFTLVELMVVIAIIGILAAVVYPSYRNYVKKAECADGIDSLMALSGLMEEFYLDNDTYVAAPLAITTSSEGRYNMDITVQTAFAFTLTASPVDTGQKILTLTSLGQKTEATGSGVTCW